MKHMKLQGKVIATGLGFPEGPIAQLQDDGATVEVEEVQSLDIESVVEVEQPRFAQPGSGG